jgi:2-C-methyl-D-erythritol 4-phosphate cytidylyltransferase
MKVSVIMPAAGKGKRLQNRAQKAFVRLGEIPLFICTLKQLVKSFAFERVIVPSDPLVMPKMKRLLLRHGLSKVELVAGGSTRSESVQRGLSVLNGQAQDHWVLVHDMARPLIRAEEIRRLVQAASRKGAAVLALKATSTVKEVYPRTLCVKKTLPRDFIYMAQTPQVFRISVLRKAYRFWGKKAKYVTDEAGLVEALGQRIAVVEGTPLNIKITTPDDLRLAQVLVKRGRL